jgi:hypothetical protein
VGGQGHRRAVGVGFQRQHAADLPRAAAAGAARLGQLRHAHRVLTGDVVDPHRAVVAQRAGQPGAGAGRVEQRPRRAVAVGQPVHGAAEQRDARPARPVGDGRVDVPGLAVRLAGGAGPPSTTSIRRGAAASRSSSTHSSPADSYTTRTPSVAACRT